MNQTLQLWILTTTYNATVIPIVMQNSLGLRDIRQLTQSHPAQPITEQDLHSDLSASKASTNVELCLAGVILKQKKPHFQETRGSLGNAGL